MKNKYIKTFVIILLTCLSFLGILSFQQDIFRKNDKDNLLDVVEQNNNYVIQNSIISPRNLNNIIENSDVKVIFIKTNSKPGVLIPNSIIINYNPLFSIKGNSNNISTKGQINQTLSKAGINNDDMIILYDIGNSPYVTRLFWTLKIYGHEFVKILNGGLNHWINDGYHTISHSIPTRESVYLASDKNEKMIATNENIKEAIKNENEIILDVRSKEAYNKGHIPSAINIPYQYSLTSGGIFKTFEALQKLYHPKGITPNKDAIYVYCNTGSRASFTYFVLHELLGYNNVKVYIGSHF
ncbi:sulfurtransferase [Mycoplasmatota bacterium]|nr:sulfurtransferase [Mycoplasmatota bacterium]